ncbi:MAG: exodeoxyribonuclease V subunit RecB [Candidatus Westeberhardia cardiocondylae]|nr:exodeoxyribonuclease V subunit RecB [Candidatus Westeberhardia cardiocondylae]
MNVVISRLVYFEENIDNISVFTIHSFCLNILKMCPIECNISLRQKLLDDEYQLYEQACINFWRRYFYVLDLKIIRIIKIYWKDPNALLRDLYPYLIRDIPKNYYNYNICEISLDVKYKLIILFINRFKCKWRSMFFDINIILKYYYFDLRIFVQQEIFLWLKKIDKWVKKETLDYEVPKELKYFNNFKLKNFYVKNVNINDIPYYLLFKDIKRLYYKIFSFRALILNIAIREIKNEVYQKKLICDEFGYDDLLYYLNNALSSFHGERLKKFIRSCYPIVLVDEFQDIDVKQYDIFYKIYFNNFICSCMLFFIGDPKQLIYSFRGSDIFSYINIRNEISFRYTLDINYRSSKNLINAVNKLFLSLNYPFVFRDITFVPSFSCCNKIFRFILNSKIQPAMHFYLHSSLYVNKDEYQRFMAYKCSHRIYSFLVASIKKDAWLENCFGRRLLTLSDIVVLVRNRYEAKIMYDVLTEFKIPVVFYSSYNSSVFKTMEAKDLFWVLRAILSPEDDILFFRALSTDILGYDSVFISSLHDNNMKKYNLIKKFIYYRNIWEKYGILSMLNIMFMKDYMIKNFHNFIDGKQKFNNIMHIGELLSIVSKKLFEKMSLVNWLFFNISNPDDRSEDQKIRIDNDNKSVKIMTIYASKGLEFPIVFLPFIANFCFRKYFFFHDRKNYMEKLDFVSVSDINFKLSDEERLSEDIRLLYVAITRAVYCCNIGISALYYHTITNKSSIMHYSSIGYLIQQGKPGDFFFLRNCLYLLSKRSNYDIVFSDEKNISKIDLLKSKEILSFFVIEKTKKNKVFNISYDIWNVTSYSKLCYKYSSFYKSGIEKLKFVLDNFKNGQLSNLENMSLNPFTFPKGVLTGVFIHSIFELLDFTKPLDEVWLYDHLVKYGINIIWFPMLVKWIKSILLYPLDGKYLSLSSISVNSKKTEMEFSIFVKNVVDVSDFECICKRYDKLSNRCLNFNFKYFYGFIKGFIDLVFFWNNKYYILDYKSNWLGDNNSCYCVKNMEDAIIDHRFDLQYQIYTLALHRFLRIRLRNYNYERDFGGVYFLFVRGVDICFPGYGVYYCFPKSELICDLDKLFC